MRRRRQPAMADNGPCKRSRADNATHSSKCARPSAPELHIDDLPQETLVRILGHVGSVRVLGVARQVCRLWHQVGGDAWVWRALYQRTVPAPCRYLTAAEQTRRLARIDWRHELEQSGAFLRDEWHGERLLEYCRIERDIRTTKDHSIGVNSHSNVKCALRPLLIPPFVCTCVNLHVLKLVNLNVQHVPPEIGNLVQLWTLDLHDNRISVIPPEIGKLVNLCELNMTYNPIRELPLELTQLVALHTLGLPCVDYLVTERYEFAWQRVIYRFVHGMKKHLYLHMGI